MTSRSRPSTKQHWSNTRVQACTAQGSLVSLRHCQPRRCQLAGDIKAAVSRSASMLLPQYQQLGDTTRSPWANWALALPTWAKAVRASGALPASRLPACRSRTAGRIQTAAGTSTPCTPPGSTRGPWGKMMGQMRQNTRPSSTAMASSAGQVWRGTASVLNAVPACWWWLASATGAEGAAPPAQQLHKQATCRPFDVGLGCVEKLRPGCLSPKREGQQDAQANRCVDAQGDGKPHACGCLQTFVEAA